MLWYHGIQVLYLISIAILFNMTTMGLAILAAIIGFLMLETIDTLSIMDYLEKRLQRRDMRLFNLNIHGTLIIR